MKTMQSKCKIVASFGAALAVLNLPQNLNADIVNITVGPSVPFNSYTGVGVFTTVNNQTVAVMLAANQFYTASFTITNLSIGTGVLTQVATYDLLSPPIYGPNNQTLGSGSILLGFSGFGGLNVGWFEVNIVSGGSMTFSGGQYGTGGESVVAGVFVPEPSAATGLALLALGAAGVRRRKKEFQPQAAA